jgi:hypothetical protein
MMPSHRATHESAPHSRVERVLYFVRFTVDVEGVQLCGFNEIQHVPARYRSSR